MDKFYAETVKRVSSGKVSLDADRGQRGSLCLERRNDPEKSSTLTASKNISIVTHAFLEEKNVSMYIVGNSVSPARAFTPRPSTTFEKNGSLERLPHVEND